MCGLLGAVVGNLTNVKFPAFIRDGLITNSVRGMDSCGIAVVDNKGDVNFQKLPVTGSMFIQDKRAAALIDSVNSARTIVMTHNRAATVGKVNFNNSHPFYFNDADVTGTMTRELIGCHNGTLQIAGQNPFDTDSEWALDRIMEEGKDAFKKFRGAFAFTWWDSNSPDTLNIALNSQRDVHIARLEQGGLLYASEAGMLHWLAERNSLSVKGDILQLQPLHHYRFSTKEPGKFLKEAIPEAPAVYTPHNNANGYNYSTRTYSTATHMQAVEQLLEKAAQSEEAKPKGKGAVAPATSDQIQTAKEMSMFGVKGKFLPLMYNTAENRTEGVFSATLTSGGKILEWDAVINGYGGGATLPDDMAWPVSVVGMADDGNEPTLFCSKPTLTLLAADNKAATH